MATVTVPFQEVQELIEEKLKSAGVSSAHAAKVAEILIHADLRGVNSHGALRTEHYMKRLNAGGINPNPTILFNQTGPATGVVDGDDGFGHVVADYAIKHAIEMAKENGVGMVTVMNSSHCGALSYFVETATKHKLIGIAMTHTDKIVVPFGGKESFLGTNPIAYGIPGKREKPFILDMATSNVALGKVLQHKEEGKEIPNGWGVDETGASVTDPAKVVSLTPFGGPKGSGLSMVIDIFSGLLAGMAFGPHITPMYQEFEKKRKLGHYFCMVNPSYFTNTEVFLEQVDKMMKEIREVPAAEGFESVLVPGEIEQRNEERNRQEGVQIAATTYAYLKNIKHKRGE
ncbi:putative oxidoreductase [Planococcus sp. PAMC 21323]|uniref:ureidoglycolate dehydrogenase n=1 Tax=Planococcus sp. PAMC 21323 TaxID=1526927 RepID=UPI00056F0DEF|nr:ureidoglycolate dehydrogenase [Planococcus sp. PAMC 21323]AIY04166.1 putative oxidoreductase [Planococcus sp. PAMC 21323]